MGFKHAVCGQCRSTSQFCVELNLGVGNKPSICFECVDKIHREHSAIFADRFNEEIKRTNPNQFIPLADISDDVENGLGKPVISYQRSLFGKGGETTIASYSLGGFILRGEGDGHFPNAQTRCWSLWYGREKSPRFPVGTRREALQFLAGLRKKISERKRRIAT